MTWVDLPEQYHNENSSSIWSNTEVDLTSYGDSIVQIAFFFHSQRDSWGNSTTSSGWYIDDIEIRTGPEIINNPETWETLLGDWYVSSGTWEVGVPTSGPDTAYNGINCAATRLDDNYSDDADDSYLTSPWISLSPASDRSRFWHWYSFSSNDYGRIMLRTINNLNWIDISGSISGTSSGTWSYTFYDLILYADSIVQIGFFFHSQRDSWGNSTTSSGWYIDDILIEDN